MQLYMNLHAIFSVDPAIIRMEEMMKMGRKWKFSILFLLCVSGFFGCAEEEKPAIPLVTGVEVTCRHGGQTIRRTYTQLGKVQRILYYLRKQKAGGYTGAALNRSSGETAWIRLRLSDGGCKVYRQRGHRAMFADEQRWRKIDDAWGRRLYSMLLLIPSDPVANPLVS